MHPNYDHSRTGSSREGTPGNGHQGHSPAPGDGGNSATTRNGRSIRISHRKTPSELTPLMRENLALQQQIELLQAQQQMLAQQQYAAAGLMPPPPPGVGGVYPQMAAPQMMAIPQLPVPQMAYGWNSQHVPVLPPASLGATTDSHHYRARSTGGSGGGGNHARRHSLAVSEARNAAQAEQVRRAENEEAVSGSPAPGSSTSSSRAQHVADTTDSSTGVFRFPPSPEQRHARTSSSHQRSTPSPVRNQFQFPAQPFTPAAARHHHQGSHSHRRSNSRNFEGNWRQHSNSNFEASSNNGSQSTLGSAVGDEQSSHGKYTSSTHLAPPAAPFVPGHHHRGSYNSVSSISAFMENSQNSNQPGRKSLFVPYLTHAAVPQLLADGVLVAGTLRVNRKNRSDAYVSTSVLDADIFICGSKDRNRALEGDLVAVELLDVNDVWDSKKEKEEKKRRRDANDDSRLVETASGELRRRGSLKSRPTQKRNDDVEVEGQTLLLEEEEQHTDDIRPLYAGHIVAILERPTGQLFSGTLGLLRPSSQATKERQDAERAEKGQQPAAEHKVDRPKIVWFKPTDKCVPLMAIPTEQVPRDFVENHQKYTDRIFVCSVKRWPITSLHPFGTLVEELGSAEDSNVDVKAILRDNNFGHHKFSNSAHQNLEEAAGNIADEVSKALSGASDREVLKQPVVAISLVENLTEQAVHLETNKAGNLELTIHTLDVTPFIREESPLDRELRHKSAGVYMVQYTSPLIPSDAVTKLMFQTGKPALALTVTLELDAKSFEIVERPTVRKTVVTPAAATSVGKFEADHAELFGKLSKIAVKFQQQRGAHFPQLDQLLDVRVPAKTTIFETDKVAEVFSELNHQVNATIAQRLLVEYGGGALLLKEAEPAIAKLESLSTVLKSAGVDIDASSASTIGKAISDLGSKNARAAIEVLLYKLLAKPRYVASGRTDPMALGHYWFNLPAYTHFNAPLRRYADLVVHRQVHQVLAGQRSSAEDEQRIFSLSSELSFRYDCAKSVQEQSIHLSVTQKVSELAKQTGYILRIGIVAQVYESAFDVVIPELSIEKRVHGDQLPLVKAEFLKKPHALELYWDPKQDAATFAPAGNSSTLKASSTADIARATSKEPLAELLKQLSTRIEGDNHIQEVRPLQVLPILVRTDAGQRAPPSISVRAVNPFFNY